MPPPKPLATPSLGAAGPAAAGHSRQLTEVWHPHTRPPTSPYSISGLPRVSSSSSLTCTSTTALAASTADPRTRLAQLQAALACLPPADVLPIDQGYLVVRRRCGASSSRYRAQLQGVRKLVQVRCNRKGGGWGSCRCPSLSCLRAPRIVPPATPTPSHPPPSIHPTPAAAPAAAQACSRAALSRCCGGGGHGAPFCAAHRGRPAPPLCQLKLRWLFALAVLLSRTSRARIFLTWCPSATYLPSGQLITWRPHRAGERDGAAALHAAPQCVAALHAAPPFAPFSLISL